MVRASLLALVLFASQIGAAHAAELPPGYKETVFETNYTLGVLRTATVGEAIVRVKERVITHDFFVAFESPANFSVKAANVLYSVAAGEKLRSQGWRTVKGETLHMAALNPIGPSQHALQILSNGAVHEKAAFRFSEGGMWLQEWGKITISDPSMRFKRTFVEVTGSTPGTLNYEIVFSGQDGQSMRFQYREYTKDNLAREAFSQEIAYPLSAKSIRYRNLSIAINAISADQITYTVTADDTGGSTPTPTR